MGTSLINGKCIFILRPIVFPICTKDRIPLLASYNNDVTLTASLQSLNLLQENKSHALSPTPGLPKTHFLNTIHELKQF